MIRIVRVFSDKFDFLKFWFIEYFVINDWFFLKMMLRNGALENLLDLLFELYFDLSESLIF